MTPRHRSRETALQILYELEAQKLAHDMDSPARFDEIIESVERFFMHFQVPNDQKAFAKELILGTLGNRKAIDQLIEKNAMDWRVTRIAPVERNILRLSTFELLHRPETPSAVIIDEAIELAKKFGSAESPSFLNGVLDAIARGRPSVS